MATSKIKTATIGTSVTVILFVLYGNLILLYKGKRILKSVKGRNNTKELNQSDVGFGIFTHEEISILKNNFTFSDDPRLIKYIELWLRPPSKSSPTFQPQSSFDHSTEGQSLFVDTLLKQKRNGFFVECGAANGDFQSNTFFFEKQRGWTGLLIEPNEQFYEEMLKKHRNAYTINACLSPYNSTGVFNFRPVSWWGGLNKHFDIIHEKYKKNHQWLYSHYQKVQCFTLYSLMLAVGQTHIDYFSLDIEEAELRVLRTIPFDKLTIDVITIEYSVRGSVVDIETSLRKLYDLRIFFKSLGTYREEGILPYFAQNPSIEREKYGLDVVFKRIKK